MDVFWRYKAMIGHDFVDDCDSLYHGVAADVDYWDKRMSCCLL